MTIETGCASSIFYASPVKTLKRQFGDTLLLADLRLKSMLDKQQIKPNNWATLRKFHHQMKLDLSCL